MFQEALVAHPPQFKSDCMPLWLRCLGSTNQNQEQRPLRFLVSWMMHSDFNKFVRTHWDHFVSWSVHLNDFTRDLQKWNKEVFGNNFVKKKKLIRKLSKLDKRLNSSNGVYIPGLIQEMWSEYQDVLMGFGPLSKVSSRISMSNSSPRLAW